MATTSSSTTPTSCSHFTQEPLLFVRAQLPRIVRGHTYCPASSIVRRRARFTASLRVQRSSVLRMPFDIRFEGPKNVLTLPGTAGGGLGRRWRSDSAEFVFRTGTCTNTQWPVRANRWWINPMDSRGYRAKKRTHAAVEE